MQLELLLVLARDPSARWTAEHAARELRAPVAWTEGQLVDFVAQGVVAYDDAPDATYRFNQSSSQAPVVHELSAAYPQRRTSIIKLIFSPPSPDIESFSDAFRLREDD